MKHSIIGGGAIACGTGSKITISSSTIGLNTAKSAGGGILLYEAISAQITNCSFLGNRVNGSLNGQGLGGAILIQDSQNVVIDACVVSGNEASADGGGIAILGSSVTVKSSQLIGNSSDSYGGGIYVDADEKTVTLDAVSVTQNEAVVGAGAYIFKGNLAGSLTALTGNIESNRIPGLGYKQGQSTAPITVPPNQQTKMQDP